jgi:hypothetical protein
MVALDWVAMAPCIGRLKLLALNNYGCLYYALNIACKLSIEQRCCFQLENMATQQGTNLEP